MQPLHLLLTALALTAAVVTASIASRCPRNCSCFLDDKGRKKVSCIEGGMVGPIPIIEMDSSSEVIEISSPENNMNVITIGPVFNGFKNLEELHITRSNVPNIGAHSFYGLLRLNILNLTQNNISTVLDNNFRGLDNLLELHLDENRIARLSSGTFQHLPSLKVLTITKNRLDELVTRLFYKLNRLHVLRLSENRLIELNPDVFNDIKTLQVFECRKCSLKAVDPKIFTYLSELETLDLGENHLKQIIPGDYLPLSNLHHLYLDSNYFTEVVDKSFDNQHSLETLNLARNRIMTVSDRAFVNLQNLTTLNIGYNKLERFDSKALKPIQNNLEHLILSGNKLSIRDIRASVQAAKQVRNLELADMSLDEVPLALIPETVKSLNLAGNFLAYISTQVFPQHLEVLDMSRNRFRGLDERALALFEQIPSLNLDRNPWSCDLCHINHMLNRANLTVFGKLRCSFPYPLEGRLFSTLRLEEVELCSTQAPDSYLLGEDGNLGVIAAGASILLLVLTGIALLGALCYSRRHAANYYTHEEKRCNDEREVFFDDAFDNPEISFKFPLDAEKKISICTIEEITKDHALINGGA